MSELHLIQITKGGKTHLFKRSGITACGMRYHSGGFRAGVNELTCRKCAKYVPAKEATTPVTPSKIPETPMPAPAKRTKHKAVLVTEIKKGNVIVMQDAIIRENGSHYSTVKGILTKGNNIILLMERGNGEKVSNSYSKNTKVCLGVEW